MERPELTILLGPTGVGKTDYSIELALEYGSPVISCDSRQIFKEMKIGTAPPSAEQLERVKHYFIFSNSVTDLYTAGRYEIEALALLEELFKSHKRLVMAGGSGLYIDALCNGLDDFPAAEHRFCLYSAAFLPAPEQGSQNYRTPDVSGYNSGYADFPVPCVRFYG